MSTMNQPKPDDPEVENVMDSLLSSVENEEVETVISGHSDGLEDKTEERDYHDQVLEYLMKQEKYAPEEEIDIHYFPDITEPNEEIEETAKIVLSQLLKDVKNITSFKEAYAQQKQLHNQYQLFDLANMIPKFHINDEVMDMMSFRETLVISKVDDKGQAEPVGGLCLDVQPAQGAQWDKSKRPPDFTKALMNACVDIKTKFLKDTTEHEQPTNDLDEYMKFLEEEMHKHYQKFLVHVSSQFNVDGKNAGSRITSWVDRNLHTIEEKRTENNDKNTDKEEEIKGDRLTLVDHPTLRQEELTLSQRVLKPAAADRFTTAAVRYIMGMCNDQPCLDQKQVCIYMGKKHYDVRVYPGQDYCKKLCYSFRRARDFVGEAANFILMRYLAIVKFIGEFELSSMHIEGGLCRNTYQCEGPMGGYINNEKLDVYKVYRTVIEECGITQRSCTLLSSDGRIMKHDWEKCNYVLQINPILSPHNKRSTMVLHFNETWKHDLQMFSKYLDKKLAASFQMKSYMFDHKEIGTLISDYVQNILQIKPNNIIQFTKHFFLSYAPYLLPRAEYFEEDVNKCFNADENDDD